MLREKFEVEYKMYVNDIYEDDCLMDDLDNELVCSGGFGFDIYRYIVGGEFIIENIGEVLMKVKSYIKFFEILYRNYFKFGEKGWQYGLLFCKFFVLFGIGSDEVDFG